MPQLDLDGANSKISADTIRGQSGTTVTVQSGHNLVGSGSGLTALNATNVTSGTLPMARLSGTLPALNGSALTNLPASTSVAFPATQVASADANTLDDYEEGTFTPAWIPTSGSWSGTFNAARYVKIGTMVWAGFTFTASAQATGTKMNGVSGLPFTSASTGLRAVPSVALSKVGLSGHILHVRVQSNGSQADMGMEQQGTGSGSEFLPAHTSASSQFSLTVCYQANA